MKFLRPCLLFISIILFGWLLMSNINLINVAESLNESEITSQIKKVNSFSEINGLKEFAIERINYMEVIKDRFSDNAMMRVSVIVVLVLIQIVLFTAKVYHSQTLSKS